MFVTNNINELRRNMKKLIKLLLLVTISASAKYNFVDTPSEKAILKASVAAVERKYHIPKHITMAIIEQESSFRINLLHPRVRTSIKRNGKWVKAYVRAKGLGGIIYGANSWILRKAGVPRSKLLTIHGNVAAIGAILAYKIKATGSLKGGIKAYYGSRNNKYYNNIIRKSRKYR